MEISIDKIILREKQFVEEFQNNERFRKVVGVEDDKLILELSKEMVDYHNTIVNILQSYQQLQADYENRLKADMVDMLTELQKEIEEVPKYCMTHDNTCVYRKAEEYITDINNVIQQKIDNLNNQVESEDKE